MDESVIWYARIPGETYAISFEMESRDEFDARSHLRYLLGIKKLPNGTELWIKEKE